MPKLVLTRADGKRRFAKLVSVSNSQRPNDFQTSQVEQINRRLPPEILAELSTRGLTIPPQEFGLLLSRLKADADTVITISD